MEESNLAELEEWVELLETTKAISPKKLAALTESVGSSIIVAGKLKDKCAAIEGLEEMISDIYDLTENTKEHKRTLKDLRNQIEEIKVEVDVCPLCEKEW